MQWCLKVRVVRLWVIPDREKEDNPQSMEMVLQDKKTTDFDEDGAYPVELNTILDKNALFKDSNPDNDLNTPTNTQAKRSLLEVESLSIEVEDDPNTQLSSTKLNKVVKKEKLA
ncbi:hypothetical protein FXO38_19135 [Capsicum annuum]|nr:hypothetical protein FXO38_19135 [Capsicum annuum]KAF3677668.1 hypothetical protein FXO37_04727 [Capsicum annuum]